MDCASDVPYILYRHQFEDGIKATVHTNSRSLVLYDIVTFCDKNQGKNHLPISPGAHADVTRSLDMTKKYAWERLSSKFKKLRSNLEDFLYRLLARRWPP